MVSYRSGIIREKAKSGGIMGKWNEQAAPNNNLSPKTIRTSQLLGKGKEDSEFAKEPLAGKVSADSEHKQKRK